MEPSNRFTTPHIFKGYPDLIAVETTRHGGVSGAPYSSLNLGKNTEDSPQHVAQNRQIISQALGITWEQVAFGTQVHGSEVLCVTEPGRYAGYDAFVTQTTGIFLSITVADCAPVMIYDPIHRACGVAHAGWRGAAARICTRTIETMMQQFSTRPDDCLVYIGTCIGADKFEVGPEVSEAFDPMFSRPGERSGKFLLDLKSAIRAEMLDLGVPTEHIEISPYCTVRDNANYFSHRKEQGKTGRFAAMMGMVEHDGSF